MGIQKIDARFGALKKSAACSERVLAKSTFMAAQTKPHQVSKQPPKPVSAVLA